MFIQDLPLLNYLIIPPPQLSCLSLCCCYNLYRLTILQLYRVTGWNNVFSTFYSYINCGLSSVVDQLVIISDGKDVVSSKCNTIFFNFFCYSSFQEVATTHTFVLGIQKKVYLKLKIECYEKRKIERIFILRCY